MRNIKNELRATAPYVIGALVNSFGRSVADEVNARIRASEVKSHAMAKQILADVLAEKNDPENTSGVIIVGAPD